MARAPAPRAGDAPARLRIAFVAEEERGALRIFLRALRRLARPTPTGRRPCSAPPAPSSQVPLRADLRDARALRSSRGEADREAVLAAPTSSCSPRAGALPAPGPRARRDRRRRRAARLAAGGLRGGARRRRARPPVRAGRRRHARRPAARAWPRDRALRERLVARGGAAARDADRRRASSTSSRRSTRRSPRAGATPPPRAPARRARRALIDVDLHMHTDHSPDCATPVEVLLATATRAGPRRDRDHRPQRDLGRARGASPRPTASR